MRMLRERRWGKDRQRFVEARHSNECKILILGETVRSDRGSAESSTEQVWTLPRCDVDLSVFNLPESFKDTRLH